MTLSCVAAVVLKTIFLLKIRQSFVNLQEIIEEIEQNILLTGLASHKTTAAKSVSSLLFISYN